ncbi:uncharacterized protein C3orf20-like [Heterodontus francisci]|uniref:uncharacterized protein C3orf20-like n=1 Tax=Heterodontus francisci TaxID=7792 RepID=UPI00355B74D6
MILHCKIAEIPFPRGLENILNYGWNDFIKEVAYSKKQWPTAACKYICMQKRFTQNMAQGSFSPDDDEIENDKNRSKSLSPREEVIEKITLKVEPELVSTSSVKRKDKTIKVQEKSGLTKSIYSTGFTISFSVSSKTCLDQGWIIKQYDENLAKLHWREVYTLMLEKIQAENAKIKLQKANMMKYGFNKPVILLHYEEARTEPMTKLRKYISMPEMPVLKDGKPQIPSLKVENPELRKLHYALNDGSAIIYYPSGNIAVCRSHSGLSCEGAFYTNIFTDSAIQPTLLASFTPFGHGSIFLPGNKAMVLLLHEEGGLMINQQETKLKQWRWPRRGKLPEPIWIQVNDYITVRILGQFSISFTYKWQYEFIRFPLSPLPDVVPPQPNEMYMRKHSSLSNPASYSEAPPTVSEITIQYLRQLHRRIKSIIDEWMAYYRSATGLSKYPPDTDIESDKRIYISQSAIDRLGSRAPLKGSIASHTDYIRFLSAPGWEKPRCLPRSCTFSRDLTSYISREGSYNFLLASRRGSLSPIRIKHGLRFPRVWKDDKPWLHLPIPCPVALRSAMLGEGMKRCRCSTNKVPNVTDLEFDTLVKRSKQNNKQIIVVCVVSSQQLEPAQCERMIQELYVQKNRNRNQPCVECQSDSFRMVNYDISTANEYTGQSPALLVERHNVTPGMFLGKRAHNTRETSRTGSGIPDVRALELARGPRQLSNADGETGVSVVAFWRQVQLLGQEPAVDLYYGGGTVKGRTVMSFPCTLHQRRYFHLGGFELGLRITVTFW